MDSLDFSDVGFDYSLVDHFTLAAISSDLHECSHRYQQIYALCQKYQNTSTVFDTCLDTFSLVRSYHLRWSPRGDPWLNSSHESLRCLKAFLYIDAIYSATRDTVHSHAELPLVSDLEVHLDYDLVSNRLVTTTSLDIFTFSLYSSPLVDSPETVPFSVIDFGELSTDLSTPMDLPNAPEPLDEIIIKQEVEGLEVEDFQLDLNHPFNTFPHYLEHFVFQSC